MINIETERRISMMRQLIVDAIIEEDLLFITRADFRALADCYYDHQKGVPNGFHVITEIPIMRVTNNIATKMRKVE